MESSCSSKMQFLSSKMLSLFYGTENERQRLVRASQSLYDYLQGCISATRTLLNVLKEHLDTSVTLRPVGGDVCMGEILDRLFQATREMHAMVEQTDRHVRKNIRQDLYAQMASPETSLREKGAIVRDFHQATMGIFGRIGGPLVAVLLRNASLPELLEAALREAEVSPVLSLPMDVLLCSSEEIAMAMSTCAVYRGPAGEMAAGVPENSPFSETGSLSETTVVDSLWSSLPNVITGLRTRNALTAATCHLETVIQALAPTCKSFRLAAATVEVYMALIAESQPGMGDQPGQNPPGIVH